MCAVDLFVLILICVSDFHGSWFLCHSLFSRGIKSASAYHYCFSAVCIEWGGGGTLFDLCIVTDDGKYV